MWEWRIFSDQKINLPFESNDIFDQANHRTDQYIIFEDINYGVKIRNFSTYPSLEIKKRVEQKGEMEFWEKIMMEPNLKMTNGFENNDEAHSILEPYSDHLPINWQNNLNNVLNIEKSRYQFQINEIFPDTYDTIFEMLKLKIEGSVYYGYCLEGNNLYEINKISLIIKNASNSENMWIMGYPAFGKAYLKFSNF